MHERAYLPLLPGLLLYGIGLALILTVNDPVSLDTVPEGDHGQASGVAATAEQFGGAIGIAGLYLIFRASYLHWLYADISAGSLAALTPQQARQFKDALTNAESVGLKPSAFGGGLEKYLVPAQSASENGYSVAFLTVSVACLVALFLMIRLVRKPPPEPDPAPATPVGGY